MSQPFRVETRYSELLDETVEETLFPTGLRLLFCPKPGFRKRHVSYSSFYGSVDSEFVARGGGKVRVPEGIAHFLEHALFETKDGHALELFGRRGAYANASTSFTTTNYVLASSGSFFDNLELLLGFVENPSFLSEKVEKEKSIIEQEIRGYLDDSGWVGAMGLLGCLFERHPIRNHIAGTVDSIHEIDSAALHLCYETFYHPENMVLCVVGDLPAADLTSFIAEKSRFASVVSPGGGPPRERSYPREPAAVHRPEFRCALDVARPKLQLGFKEVDVPTGGEDLARRELESAFALDLAFGKSTETYEELYRAGWILDDFGASYGAGAGIGHAILGGDTPDPEKLRDLLLARIEGFRRTGFSPADFDRRKTAFLGGYIRGFNSLEHIGARHVYHCLHGFDFLRAMNLVADLSPQAIEARFRTLVDPEHHAVSIITGR